VGTGIGGITGPLLFSALITTGKLTNAALALTIGAVMMILGGIAEIVFGVRAERRGLEDIAQPLSATGADARGGQAAAAAA
jgi:hypothetical protein